MTLVQFVTQSLSVLTVVAQVGIIVVLASIVAKKDFFGLKSFFTKKSLVFSFTLAVVATLGSLFYSQVAGYDPCDLCWWQRIFMYPQAVLFGIALWKKQSVALHGIVLSALGGAVAAYHYLGQIGVVNGMPCPTVGYSVSCSQIFFMQFGYITFPLMALTAFIGILILQWLTKNN